MDESLFFLKRGILIIEHFFMKMSYNFDDGGVCFKSVQHRFYYEINEREGGTTFSFSCNK